MEKNFNQNNLKLETVIVKEIEERYDEMLEIRRHLHQNPELSFQEKETSAYIKDFYKGKDVEIIHENEGYGFIVEIESDPHKPWIALRADFDALPIHEETKHVFKSKNDGIMHACGHDVHTAYMMVLADILLQHKNELGVNIKIIHQHAEEVPPGGAIDFLKTKELDNVSAIFGSHIIPFYPSGTVVYRKGLMFAGSGVYHLKIKGLAGHGSSPESANDAIIAGSYFVMAVQTIISRRLSALDSGVISIGSFDGKGIANVIQDQVTLEASLRYLNEDVKEKMIKELNQIAKGLETMFAVEVVYEYEEGYPPLLNDDNLTDFYQEVFAERKDLIENFVEMPEPVMGSEDFAHFSNFRPSFFFYFTASDNTDVMNHNPKFSIDEKSMISAAKTMAAIVLNFPEYLNSQKKQ